ncbi:MAG: carbohydrate binding family 9 domain-containing protein [Bacteroidetes bacterium]|nr:carbohydrate binding family 9 domain-containing protein [Bacteroidota bacterium]
MEKSKKQLQAIRIEKTINIDGILDEAVWLDAPIARDFKTYSPTMGDLPSQPTEVRVIYDDRAVYIAAICYEEYPDSIMKEFTKRDNIYMGNTDSFKITLNPYNDGQNIYQFQITTANVQADSKKSVSSGRMDMRMRYGDFSWNAVWESAVKITDEGWILEIAIPYAAIRFPKEDVQTWGINFWRTIRRIRETSSWNPVDRSFAEEDQDGELHGISSIKAPLRLELYPFAAGYYEINPESKGASYAAGLDLKYGINEAYTLDMTLIPDFGQRKSDDIVLNLSPYEIKYRENRQFFTEGLELFSKADIFYSRRIGKQPGGYYDVYDLLEDSVEFLENPPEVKLINATKISGRSSNNLGLGFFNAMTANTYARYKNPEFEEEEFLTEPFTNYNMLVADQIIGRNSFVNLANTNVYSPSQTMTANVTAVTFKMADKNNMYSINGNLSYSSVLEKDEISPVSGYKVNFGGGKYGGNVQATYNISLITDTYNPNHMGYLKMNNAINHDLSFSYRLLEPYSVFNSMSHSIMLGYDQLFTPREYARFGGMISSRATFRNYWDVRLSLRSDPFGSQDWYEPRVSGWFYARPAYAEIDVSGSTDYRKQFAMQLGFERRWNAEDEKGWEISTMPRIRVNDKLSITPRIKLEKVENEIGYTTYLSEDSIVFGRRMVTRVTNQLSASYVFNNVSALSLSMRHYWSAVDYNKYYMLESDGTLSDYPEYSSNEDINFNILSIDLEYSWNLAPGSFLTIVWKNNIYASEGVDDDLFVNYWDNFGRTINAPQTNSFSAKLTYYLDYQTVIRPRLPFP